MTETRFEIDFPPSMMTDNTLVTSFTFICQHQDHAPMLCVAAAHILAAEGNRRDFNRSNPSERLGPGRFVVDFADWSDRDVGEALKVLSVWTSRSENPEFGEYADAFADVVTLAAAERLTNSADPRNKIPFDQRNQHDPETN